MVEELLLRRNADSAEVALVEVAVVMDDGFLGQELEVIGRGLFTLGLRRVNVSVELACVLIAIVGMDSPTVDRYVGGHPTLG